MDEAGFWQPTFEGTLIFVEPLRAEHRDALFTAASDPGIWEQHPVRNRHEPAMFSIYFDTAMASQGALLVRDRSTGVVVGSSRFVNYDPARRTVEIGYTFLARDLWGTGANRELKSFMMRHAFSRVDRVEFVVGVNNHRSRRAMENIGAHLDRFLVEREPEGDLRESVVYVMNAPKMA
jgi:RimJ/RimL family protein N-acetyltransferase